MSDDQPTAPRKSVATLAYELAAEHYRMGVSDTGNAYGIPRGDTLPPHIVQTMRDGQRSFRATLAKLYRETHGTIPGKQALSDALTALEGVAQDMTPRPLHLRVAEHEGHLWLDMGDADGHLAQIAPGKVTVETSSPVLFRRTSLSLELPMPVLPEPSARGTADALAELWEFVNVTEADRPLVLASLVASFFPDIAHPIVTLAGEQGSGKSTAAARLIALMDPQSADLRSPPRDAERLELHCVGSWVIGYDNMTGLPPWLMDHFCRVVTGSADAKRKLYSDGELIVTKYRRQLVLTGIDFAGLNADLAERLVTFNLERFTPGQRVDEATLQAHWTAAYPRIFGACLALAALVLAKRPGVAIPSGDDPRMRDYARILLCVDDVLGSNGYPQYVSQSRTNAADTLASDAFLDLVQSNVQSFDGTGARLLQAMELGTPDDWTKPRDWPKHGRDVTTRMTRAATALRANGWTVTHRKDTSQGGTTVWTLIRPGHPDPAQPLTPAS